MSQFYAVLTFPAYKRDWVYANLNWLSHQLDVAFPKYPVKLLVLENGSQGNNPHLNYVVETDTKQHNTSYFRQRIIKFVYDELDIQVTKPTLVIKSVSDKDKLLQYIFKEEGSKILLEKGGYMEKTPEQYKKEYWEIHHSSKNAKKGKYQIITKTQIVPFLMEYIDTNGIEFSSYEDFVELIVSLKHEGVIMLDILNKPKHYYAMLTGADTDDQLRSILIQNGSLN